jgi:hypothetical protein
MAHFYGKVSGKSGTDANRQGSRASGLRVEAVSWDGVIEAHMWHDTAASRDMVRVTARQHPGDKRLVRGATYRVLYEGPVGDAWFFPGKSATAA